MKILDSKYNPLSAIFAIIRENNNPRDISYNQILFIVAHLAKAGVIYENPSELQTLLEMLVNLKMEYYGES